MYTIRTCLPLTAGWRNAKEETHMQGKRFIFLLLAASLGLVMLGVFAVNAVSALDGSDDGNDIRFYAHSNGIGAGGYDVVAYFEENKAIRGKAEFSAEFGGMPWHFRSAAARDAFVADPGKYLPAYGGHCAYGVAQGYLVRGDPEAWTIRNGKLYLNYNKNVRNAWLADVEQLLSRSEENWPGLNT